MRNLWSGTLAALAIAAIGINAQAQQHASSTVTVVGCLQHATENGSMAGTVLGTSAPPERAGTLANLNEPQGFMLADATPAKATGANEAPTGTSGATTGRATKETRTSYMLQGDVKRLNDYVGRRVEVTGAVAPPVSSGANEPASSRMRAGTARLHVASIRPVAADCQSRK